MPGNRQIYDQAMNMGHSAAWDQEWDKAIAAYGRAVQEMPEDPAAHNSLGLALLQARRLEDALKVYMRAHQLAPDDPIPLEKSADVLERLGRLKEAAQQYIKVAEIYLGKQRDMDKAISNWERATNLTGGLIHIHQKLALAYERTGQRRPAIREYLTLAFNFQRSNRLDVARQAVDRALRLEPNNPQALNTLQALETGTLIPEELLESLGRVAHVSTEKEHDLAFDRTIVRKPGELRDIGDADMRGPIGEAVEAALEALASYVFESGDLDLGGASAIQAIEFQRQEMYSEAADAYNSAIQNSMGHAGVYLNLGFVQLQKEDWSGAISNLQVASNNAKFAAGAMHGLSIAFAKREKHRMAANHIIQTLRLVDVGLALTPEEATQLDAIYDKLTLSINEAQEEQLVALADRFLKLLTGADWKQRVTKTRRQLEEAISSQEEGSLIDIALIDDNVTHGMSMIDRYMQQGLFWLAMDQAHFMLESAPDYLPIHQRIAQLLLERDNIQAAMTKLNLTAETYRMRGDNERAAEILHEAIKIAPMDTDLHQSLIHLLEEEGNRQPEILSQFVEMADAYYQLADLERAHDTYQKAIKLAQQIDAPIEQVIHIMHQLGDIEVSRLNLKQALRTYEQIRKMAPDDDRARRSLVDLNYRQNDQVAAISELDGLLRVYAKTNQAKRIIQVLEELVTRYPKDMALRSRLAAVYRQTGNTAKAVEQLDTLADLQLQNGLHNDAIVTIRRIIALNPPQVADYKSLLSQLTGGQTE